MIILFIVEVKMVRRMKKFFFFFPSQVMKWEPKNIRDAVIPNIILNWFAALHYWEYPLGKPRPLLTYFYVFLIATSYWYANYHDPSEKHSKISDVKKFTYRLLKYVNMSIAICSIGLSWRRNEECKVCIIKLALSDKVFERLGLPTNYRKIFMNSLLKTMTWVMMTCILILCDIYFLIQIYNLVDCIHLIFLLHFPTQLNSVVDFTFTSFVNTLGLKFESINILLKRILSKDPKLKTVKELYPHHSRVSALIMSTEYSDVLNDRERKMTLIILIRHLHMEISEISFQVNKVYEKQLTMTMTACLSIMTIFSYNLFSIIFFSKQSHQNFKAMISMGLWCIVYAFRLLNVISTCTKVSSESRKPREILLQMKNSISDIEIKREIEQFSLQLTHRPLFFTACGLSTLDFDFIRRFLGVMTTYLVVLVNFSPEIHH